MSGINPAVGDVIRWRNEYGVTRSGRVTELREDGVLVVNHRSSGRTWSFRVRPAEVIEIKS